MDRKLSYRDFVGRYLARTALGVSVGLAGVAPTAAAAQPGARTSFSARLSTVRAAVSDHVNEPPSIAQVPGTPHPPPPPPQPFKNFFGKAPFQDAFRNVPQPPKK